MDLPENLRQAFGDVMGGSWGPTWPGSRSLCVASNNQESGRGGAAGDRCTFPGAARRAPGGERWKSTAADLGARFVTHGLWAMTCGLWTLPKVPQTICQIVPNHGNEVDLFKD